MVQAKKEYGIPFYKVVDPEPNSLFHAITSNNTDKF